MRFASLAATAALTFAAPVQAATIVQTGSFSNLTQATIQKFNPIWGTLTSIIVDQTFSISGSQTLFGPIGGAAPSQFQIGIPGSLFTEFGGGSVGGSSVQDFGPANSISVSFSKSTSFTNTFTAAQKPLLIGTGNYQFYFTGSPLGPLSVFKVFGPDFATRTTPVYGSGVSYSITYVYDAPGPIPEPATWAMMIAGFGLVGGAMRSRRYTSQPTRAAKP